MTLHTIKFTQADTGLITQTVKLKEGDYITANETPICFIELDDNSEIEIMLKSPVSGKVKKCYVMGGKQVIRRDNPIIDIEIDEQAVTNSQEFATKERPQQDIIFSQFDNAVIEQIFIKENDILEDLGTVLFSAKNDDISFNVKNKVCGKVLEVYIKQGEPIKKGDVVAKIEVYSELDLCHLALDKVKEAAAELEAAPREMRKALFDLNNLGNEIEEFGEDGKLSKAEFTQKYGGRTYSDADMNRSFLRELVLHHCHFSVKTESIADTVELVEKMVEDCGYSCRVYMENRAAAMAAAAIPGLGMLAGAAAAVAIGAHILGTYNPDFEIGKDFVNGKVNVTYKK